jgi:hypothetical protein
MIKKVVVSILIGVLLGFIGARVLFVGSWLSLIPWGIAGVAIGTWSQKREWLVTGSSYGFAIAFVFMVAGYAGSASLLSRLPFFAILGVIGAVCGLMLGVGGYWLKSVIKK